MHVCVYVYVCVTCDFGLITTVRTCSPAGSVVPLPIPAGFYGTPLGDGFATQRGGVQVCGTSGCSCVCLTLRPLSPFISVACFHATLWSTPQTSATTAATAFAFRVLRGRTHPARRCRRRRAPALAPPATTARKAPATPRRCRAARQTGFVHRPRLRFQR